MHDGSLRRLRRSGVSLAAKQGVQLPPGFPHSYWVSLVECAVFDEVPASPGYYRERAKDMLKKARASHTEAARKQFLKLAEYWDRLSKTVSYPSH